MYSTQEIRHNVNKNLINIKKLHSLYSIDLKNNYHLECQNRINNIQQKLIQSSETSDKKEELDLLLEVIEDIDYLLSFKKEFKDNKEIEQIISKSDLIAIEFGLLYLSYCLTTVDLDKMPEDYINRSLSPLEMIAHIFIFRTNSLDRIEMKKLEEMLDAFHTLINHAKVFSSLITIDNYNFKTYQELKFKLSRSLQSIYSCLFILNQIKQEREQGDIKFTYGRNNSNHLNENFRNKKAIKVLDSFIKDGDAQEQKETWEAIKPGLMKSEEASF